MAGVERLPGLGRQLQTILKRGSRFKDPGLGVNASGRGSRIIRYFPRRCDSGRDGLLPSLPFVRPARWRLHAQPAPIPSTGSGTGRVDSALSLRSAQQQTRRSTVACAEPEARPIQVSRLKYPRRPPIAAGRSALDYGPQGLCIGRQNAARIHRLCHTIFGMLRRSLKPSFLWSIQANRSDSPTHRNNPWFRYSVNIAIGTSSSRYITRQ